MVSFHVTGEEGVSDCTQETSSLCLQGAPIQKQLLLNACASLPCSHSAVFSLVLRTPEVPMSL